MDPELHEDRPDSGYFSAVLSYYAHQNQLLWSRLQTAAAIQAASIGGAYALRIELCYASVVVLVLGAFLTVLLWLVMRRDRQLRDMNEELLKELAARLSSCRHGTDLPPFALKEERQGASLRGRIFVRCVVVSMLVADAALAVIILVQHA